MSTPITETIFSTSNKKEKDRDCEQIDCTIRPYKSTDCPQMAALFYETVHSVNARDYTQKQLDAWADGQTDLAAWDASFLAHRTLVALWQEQLVGFADMDENGYLDRLYVHKDFQGKRIATCLCDRLEEESGAAAFTTHASLTARPFFQARGYRVCREQQVIRRQVALTNFVMEKENTGHTRQPDEEK